MTFLPLLLALAAVNILWASRHALARVFNARAESRNTAALTRQQLLERIRTHGVRRFFVYMASQYRLRVNPMRREQATHQQQRLAIEQQRSQVRKQIWRDGEWSIGFVIVVSALALAWALLFLIQRNLDIRMLLAVGYAESDPALAQLLGTAIALGITILGFIISGLLGMHALLPNWLQVSQTVRGFSPSTFWSSRPWSASRCPRSPSSAPRTRSAAR